MAGMESAIEELTRITGRPDLVAEAGNEVRRIMAGAVGYVQSRYVPDSDPHKALSEALGILDPDCRRVTPKGARCGNVRPCTAHGDAPNTPPPVIPNTGPGTLGGVHLRMADDPAELCGMPPYPGIHETTDPIEATCAGCLRQHEAMIMSDHDSLADEDEG